VPRIPAAAWAGTAAQSLQRHGVGRSARNPEAVRPRAMAAASRSAGQLATRPWTRCLWCSIPAPSPAENNDPAELYEWVRREKQCAKFGADTVTVLKIYGPVITEALRQLESGDHGGLEGREPG
jgi:hypothetical protein